MIKYLIVPGLKISELNTAQPLSVDSNSEQCFSFTQNSLQNCINNHNACGSSANVKLPKRLINVGCSNEDISLFESTSTTGSYAILSYCWGNSSDVERLKSTSNFHGEHQNKIPWECFPKTIQDAILITRRLSLTYIWVDSFCIMQDSKLDWEIESSKMCEYYSNAQITISASSGINANSGVLGPRMGLTEPVCKTFHISGGCSGTFRAQKKVKAVENIASSAQYFGPLSKRGWAYQENLLSKRIIHYTSSELVWECCTETVSEDGSMLSCGHKTFTERLENTIINRSSTERLAEKVPNRHFDFYLLKKKIASKFMKTPATHLMSKLADQARLWQELVENFTIRSLTFSLDRLPAIAGLAKRLQQGTGFRYVAGLWEETILWDLLWSTRWFPGGFMTNPELEDYQKENSYILDGPSWSWGSILSMVEFRHISYRKTQMEEFATIININVNTISGDPFSRATSGTIQIRGPLTKLSLTTSEIDSPMGYKLSFFDECPREEELLFTYMTADTFLPKEEYCLLNNNIGSFGSQQYESPERCRTTQSYYLKDPVYYLRILGDYGLVLRRSKFVQDAYTRIGLCIDGKIFDLIEAPITTVTII